MPFIILAFILVLIFALIALKVVQNGHAIGTPIFSRYISFNTREIIYEMPNGNRVAKMVSKSFGSPFPIPTSSIGYKANKVFKEILEDNISEDSKISLAIDYKVNGKGYPNMIGRKFQNYLVD